MDTYSLFCSDLCASFWGCVLLSSCVCLVLTVDGWWVVRKGLRAVLYKLCFKSLLEATGSAFKYSHLTHPNRGLEQRAAADPDSGFKAGWCVSITLLWTAWRRSYSPVCWRCGWPRPRPGDLTRTHSWYKDLYLADSWADTSVTIWNQEERGWELSFDNPSTHCGSLNVHIYSSFS